MIDSSGDKSASLIKAETFGMAPLTAPLYSGELPAGLRGSFFRSFIRARPLAGLTGRGSRVDG